MGPRLKITEAYNKRLVELFREIDDLTPPGWKVSTGPAKGGTIMVAALFDADGNRTKYQGTGVTREQAVLALRETLDKGVRA